VLHLDLAAAPATPHLPRRRLGAGTQVAASAVLHAVLLVTATLVRTAALRFKITGTVVLEAVVTTDGRASQIRVVRSLDRGGLDDEAIAAVAQWRFEPGRLEGTPVDVLVTILVDFSLR
jgi:TonB family protein